MANPFKQLKGFVVSAPDKAPPKPATPAPAPPVAGPVDFDQEMAALGVKPLTARGRQPLPAPEPAASAPVSPLASEAEQFRAALGELDVSFRDHLPDEDDEEAAECSPQASARRLKRLRQGRISPEAELDLHGLTRPQALERLGFFLQDSRHQGYKAVLVVTGRGQHSPDGPVLRAEVERWLQQQGRELVVEWCRAPRQYGGDGALVLFLRGTK